MADFLPAPTWAPLGLKDEKTGEFYFNPVWLDWFLAVVQLLNAGGGGGGTFVHNDLTSLQGGSATERYHFTLAQHTYLAAFSGTSFTSGSILFAGTTGEVTQDNASLFFDNTNNQILLFTGAVGNPSYSFVGDADTGFYRNAANQITVALAGATVLRFIAQHASHMGTAPTITAGGGTSPSIVGRDQAFTVTIGTGGVATGFTVTFANTFTNAPVPSIVSDTDIVAFKAVSTTTTVAVTATAALTAGSKVHVTCGSWE